MAETHMQLNWKLNAEESSNKNQLRKTNPKNMMKDKYKFREASLKKRNEVEVRAKKEGPKKRGPKPRPKPQPMSKYRRKTANLRERQRMGEINVAYEVLRAKIPTPAQPRNASRCEKLTKINILHVAINYIRALESILETGDAGIQVYGTSVVQSPNLPLSPECEPPMVEKVAKNPPKTNPSAIRKATLKKVGLVSNTPTTTLNHRTKNPSSSSSSNSVDSGINMDQDSDQEPDNKCPDWTELTSTLELFPSQHRGNLDTLLSSANLATETPPIPPSTKVLQPRDLNRSNSNWSSTSKLLDLENFFDDLNSSYDSLEADSEGMIPFEEDPFQLVF